ncbi:hypothetical protein T4D_11197 [Trichinella pseudospiralis]|uniref:Uncharacterized protein n=1 Tax=Trichinella pseudospiralis TaxID=6337 RepID=A0A0V1DRU7_TRIPS|nr:hypothetical protein T4D_11197 [Trichinella pseudospiralis]
MFLSVSRHTPGPTLCISFPTFLLFLAIFQVRQCAFLIFHVLNVSHQTPDPNVFFLPYSRS